MVCEDKFSKINFSCKLITIFGFISENRDRAMSESELYQALSELPEANKDTLAFLMLHLLK